MFFPFPDFLEEFFTAKVVAGDFLGIKLAFNNNLGGDAGMVCAGDPGGAVAFHTVVAYQAVHDGLVEGMPHVQGAGDVRWWQLDGECGFAFIECRTEVSVLFPCVAPAFFNF